MRFPGGKGASYQRIINEMPPHQVYIETHLGGGNVLERKRAAARSIGIDADPLVIDSWRERPGWAQRVEVVQADAVTWLQSMPRDIFRGALVYCDPPYLRTTRRDARPLYRYEYTEAQHVQLLEALLALPCYVMVSGYPSPLYDEALIEWRRIEYTTQTRSGPAREVLWLNFVQTPALHDYSYLGEDYRERERIRKKQARWERNFSAMTAQERAALINILTDQGTPTPPPPAGLVRRIGPHVQIECLPCPSCAGGEALNTANPDDIGRCKTCGGSGRTVTIHERRSKR